MATTAAPIFSRHHGRAKEIRAQRAAERKAYEDSFSYEDDKAKAAKKPEAEAAGQPAPVSTPTKRR